MHRALLAELQQHRTYPCVTILANTNPGVVMSPPELAKLLDLIDQAGRRLQGDVSPLRRASLIDTLTTMAHEAAGQPGSQAIALCASPTHWDTVRLGRAVIERVVIDDTFATRDLVADLNRTAMFRVLTISERKARLLAGTRQRLVEERDDGWPLVREDDENVSSFVRRVNAAFSTEERRGTMPTVICGVERAVRHVMGAARSGVVGTAPGNHDRTGWVELHHLAWPIVSDWLRTDQRRAMELLDEARSNRRFAGGIEEVWPLARDGRVEVLVVEEGHMVAARVQGDRIVLTDERDDPGVVDDIVDDTIEAVLAARGRAVMVPDHSLADHDRIAAVLRY
jgi:hypothetical protein